MTEENTDRDLIDRIRSGDEEALSRFYAESRERLGKMVQFRMDPRLAARMDPEDVLQEAWIAARQRIHHWIEAPERDLFVWLRLITSQTLVDLHRKHLGTRMRDARREVVPGHGGPAASTVSIAGRLLASVTSPSQAAMKAEISRRLEKALDAMDPIDREVLVLRHFEELSNNEVAEVLGMKKTATSNRYVRALGRLRGILESMPGFPGGTES